MNEEFSQLAADIREQIAYLGELGADGFAVELPETLLSSQSGVSGLKPAAQNQSAEISRERLEKFIPDFAELKIAQPAKPAPTEPPKETPTRRGILEQTKLSRLPSLPKRESFVNNFQPNEPRENKDMPAKKIIESPTESLFGDFIQKLPESNETLEQIRADIGDCKRCPLWEGRTNIVHSTGNQQADLMFVGEAPGADEDAQGKPFVGRSGQLLTKIIESIGIKREDVFIGNINRCRPPGNRAPTLPEAHTCRPFLTREIAVVRPKVIVVMGNTAMKNLLDTKEGITKLRGEFQDYYGVKVMPTFHPAYLLRDPSKKREVWEDMKKVRDELSKTQ